MKRKVFVLLFLTTLSVLSYSQKKNKEYGLNSLYTYNFSMEKLTMKDQAKLIDSLGYKGFLLRGLWDGYSSYIEEFYNLPEAKSGKLKILGIFFPIQLEKSDSLLLATLPTLSKYNISLYPIFWPIQGTKSQTDSILLNKLSELCEIAKNYNLNVIIYPHVGSLIGTAEQSVTYIKKLKKDNLYTSFHLCHEIPAGNKNRIDKALKEVIQYTKAVSISGSDTIHCSDCPYWPQYIKPLGDGAFDTRKFYKTLKKMGYEGPIILHTYGIEQDPRNHLARSMKVWRSFIYD